MGGLDPEQRAERHPGTDRLSRRTAPRCKHPELRKIVTTGRRLLLLNQRQYGARRGLLVSGDPTTGKSTAITQLGRAVELAYRRPRPRSDDAAPVVYLTMPPQATPKSLSIEILKFLGAPYLARDSQIELTRQACHLLADLRNRTFHSR